MLVIPFTAFKQHGKLPVFGECTIDYTEIPDRKKAFVVFITHRWFSPDSELGEDGHPDTDSLVKYRLVLHAMEWLKAQLRESEVDGQNLYLWLDYACVHQYDPLAKARGVRSLPAYIERCDALLTPVADDMYSACSEEKERWLEQPLPSFCKKLPPSDCARVEGLANLRDTWSRAWVRLEAFMGSNIPLDSSIQFSWFQHVNVTARSDRPHFVVTPEHLNDADARITVLPCGNKSILNELHPAKGFLTDPTDMDSIKELMSYVGFDDGEVSKYEGEEDEAGLPHGHGRRVAKDGEEYVGQWSHGKFHGVGRLVKADGSTYEGQFKDHCRHGEGWMTYTSGQKYVGQWADDKRHGYGFARWADGMRYVGYWLHGKRAGLGQIVTQFAVQKWGVSLEAGDVLEGRFEKNDPVGEFIRTTTHGEKIYLAFEGGILKSEEPAAANDRRHLQCTPPSNSDSYPSYGPSKRSRRVVSCKTWPKPLT